MVRRRNRAPGGRPLSCMVALSLEEAALLRIAADRDGMALGAWVGEAALRVARQGVTPTSSAGEDMQALMVMRAEVMEHRRLLRNVGGNLNDVARHANSTGAIHVSTTRVLSRVEDLVARVDELVGNLDALTRALRRSLQRGK